MLVDYRHIVTSNGGRSTHAHTHTCRTRPTIADVRLYSFVIRLLTWLCLQNQRFPFRCPISHITGTLSTFPLVLAFPLPVHLAAAALFFLATYIIKQVFLLRFRRPTAVTPVLQLGLFHGLQCAHLLLIAKLKMKAVVVFRPVSRRSCWSQGVTCVCI